MGIDQECIVLSGPGTVDCYGDFVGCTLNQPTDVAGCCCYGGVVSDTGNDRLVMFYGGDPVEGSSWGLIKSMY